MWTLDIAKSQFAIMSSRPETPNYEDFRTLLFIYLSFTTLLTIIYDSWR